MSTVAISQTVGSLGDEIGRGLARMLEYQFADREIIAAAAERFHEETIALMHVTEEKPSLLERVRRSERHSVTAVRLGCATLRLSTFASRNAAASRPEASSERP